MKLSVKEISQRLASDPFRVASMLLPAGRQHGSMFECGGVNGHTGKSLKVYLQGEKAGKWADYADTDHGDLLDLWAAVRGVALPEAIKQAKEWLGIEDEPLAERVYSRPPKEHPAIAANGAAMTWLVNERKLTPAIVNRYKVKGCPERKAIVFASYAPDGTLLNHSYRTLTEKKEVWQEKNCAPSLWGWQGISESAWEKREILICEGQIDAMTWAQWGVDALSIPNGSGKTWIEYEFDNLEAFHTIYLSFDNDGKSDENLRETVNRLGKHRCRVVKMPAKDANDALKAGKTHEDARQWLSESKYVDVPHLASATKFTDKVVKLILHKGAEVDGHDLDFTRHKNPRKHFRFRDGELTLWTGTTGHGKSTLLNWAGLQLAARTKRPTLIVSMETEPPEIIRRQIFQVGMNPTNEEDVRACVSEISKRILFYDRIGHIAKKDLFDMMNYARARYDVANVIIDSLMRVDGMEEDYPAQTAFVIDCVTFARETGCHVHLVAHPRKSAGDESPKSQDVAGSGNLRNNADNILVLWRNVEKERKREDGEDISGMPDAILSVEKDRVQGEFRKFALQYDYERYKFAPFVGELKEYSNRKKK